MSAWSLCLRTKSQWRRNPQGRPYDPHHPIASRQGHVLAEGERTRQVNSVMVECERPEGWRLQVALTTSNSDKEFYRG